MIFERDNLINLFSYNNYLGPYVLEHSPLLFMRLQKSSSNKHNDTNGSSFPPIISNENNVSRPNSASVLEGYGDSQTNFLPDNTFNTNDKDNNVDIMKLKENSNGKVGASKIRLNNESYTQFNPLALKCTLTHPPNRPLINIVHPSAEPSFGKIRCKKADFPLINR